MKTNKLFLATFAIFAMLTTTISARDNYIPETQLPTQAQTFLNQYFSGDMILSVEKEGKMKPTYEVCLNNGFEITFDRNGDWNKVESTFCPVPKQLVPKAIWNYLEAVYGDVDVLKLNKKSYIYDVEISNGLVLKMSYGGYNFGIKD